MIGELDERGPWAGTFGKFRQYTLYDLGRDSAQWQAGDNRAGRQTASNQGRQFGSVTVDDFYLGELLLQMADHVGRTFNENEVCRADAAFQKGTGDGPEAGTEFNHRPWACWNQPSHALGKKGRAGK